MKILLTIECSVEVSEFFSSKDAQYLLKSEIMNYLTTSSAVIEDVDRKSIKIGVKHENT
jgi:hypothetical protein